MSDERPSAGNGVADLISGRVPGWAVLLVLGVLGYGWMTKEFPTRSEEEMRHNAVADKIKQAVEDGQRSRSDLESKIGKVADLIETHAKQPSHTASAQSLAEHTIRLNQHDDALRGIAVRMETNENLLRDIKASLDAGKGRR